MKPFTSSQNENINRGRILHDQLTLKVLHALGKADLEVSPKRHNFISSTPGAGKSWTVRETAAAHKVPLINIFNTASMSNFVTTMAYAAYMSPKQHLRVWIDDCDSLFIERESLAVMKGVLDEDTNMLTWNKNMTYLIRTYEKSPNDDDQNTSAALRHFQTDGSGVSVPTDNMTFIITSNKFLTPPNSDLTTMKKMNEAAIRDRVMYTEYRLGKEESWGWIAHILMTGNVLNLKKAQKHILLDWMYQQWERLPATSMRAVKEYAADMINHPTNYPDYWDSKLIRP